MAMFIKVHNLLTRLLVENSVLKRSSNQAVNETEAALNMA